MGGNATCVSVLKGLGICYCLSAIVVFGSSFLKLKCLQSKHVVDTCNYFLVVNQVY